MITVTPAVIAIAGQPVETRRTEPPAPPAPTTRLAVQRGVLKACEAAAAPFNARVFDHVDFNRDFPFVALDNHQTLENDGADILGFTHNFFLSVWSDYRGKKEVEEIMDAIWRAVHERRLPLENGVHVLCRVGEMSADRDADGVTYQGTMALRIISNPF